MIHVPVVNQITVVLWKDNKIWSNYNDYNLNIFSFFFTLIEHMQYAELIAEIQFIVLIRIIYAFFFIIARCD